MELTGIQWTVAAYATQIIEILISGACFFMLAAPFTEKKKSALFAGAVYCVSMATLCFIPVNLDFYSIYGVSMLFTFLVMYETDKRNHRQKIFISALFFSLHLLTFAMADIIYMKVYSLILDTKFMQTHEELSFALYVGVCVFYLLIEAVLTAAAVRFIIKAYSYRRTDMSGKELFMLMLPSLAAAAGFEVTRYYRTYYIYNTGKNTDTYDLLALLYYTVSAITVVIVVVLYQKIKAKQEEKLHAELLASQLESMRHSIDSAEKLYQNLRNLRHDVTNHLITLERLYAANKINEARAYGDELKAALSEGAGGAASGNPVTDVILQGMKNDAEHKNIRFQSEFYYPSESGINAFDLSVILNNALQNAVENARDCPSPYISVFSYRQNNAFMIEIRNSFAKALQWNAESGLPVTSKAEKDGHGYGLSNIRAIARKYSGDIEIICQNGEFRLIVMLMMQ